MLTLRVLADTTSLLRKDGIGLYSNELSTRTSQSTVLLNLFFALQFISLGGLLLIFTTVLVSGRVTKRHPIWVNFVLSWIISCISYSFMVGRSMDSVPPSGLCFTQAVLIYTVPSLTAGATFALLVHVLIFFRISFTFPEATRPRAIWYVLLISVPYIPALGMLFLSVAIGISDPGTVKRHDTGMYCNMRNEFPGKLSAIIVTVWMAGCIVLEVLIVKDLRRHWEAIRNEVFAHVKGTVVRIFVFSGSTIVAGCLGLLFFFWENHGAALNIVIALIPLNATLVFGSQEDVIRSWLSIPRATADFFRRRRSNSDAFDPYSSTTSREPMIRMTTWSNQSQSVTVTQPPQAALARTPTTIRGLSFNHMHTHSVYGVV